jgi:serine/threonine-protein kinase HipA
VTTPLDRVTALAVHLHGERIGVITRTAGERHAFEFEESYFANDSRPTLSLSFKGVSGDLIAASRRYATKLPPFFSNLLPEGHLRDYLAKRAKVKPEREFHLLALLGADLPGAVTVTPLTGAAGSGGEVPMAELVTQEGTGEPLLRFSLAGVQLKFSAIAETTGGLTIPADGMGGSWIVKLPSARFPAVPENEFAMLELARAIGIEVPAVKLVPVNALHGLPSGIEALGAQALAVERFDRSASGRVHMEDFAQVFGLYPGDKYEKRSYANIAAVLAAEAGTHAVDDFVRRLVFSVLIGNADMHLKNWSLLFRDGRTPTLSPAYDYVATRVYLPQDSLALSFGGSKSLDVISLDQLRRFSNTGGLSFSRVLQVAHETVERTRAAWTDLPARELLPDEMRLNIGAHLGRVAIV